ncbi:hypothetical protein BD408DRAFT_406908 [Parasitella parasitica]|nr:hypothetical protein BD408DRAFT_406908 [Parasitella parasitica]
MMVDTYEKIITDNSGDDFQLSVTFRKRSKQSDNSARKRAKDEIGNTYAQGLMIGESSKTTQPDSFMNVPNVNASKSDSTATKPGSTTKSFDDKTRKKSSLTHLLFQNTCSWKNWPRKEFFVEVFLSLIQNTTRRSVKLKDTTAE